MVKEQVITYRELIILVKGCREALKMKALTTKSGADCWAMCCIMSETGTEAAFFLIERSLAIAPTFPKELINAYSESI